ncbi:hypothetical protein ES705_44513 [subsurface metagenome]
MKTLSMGMSNSYKIAKYKINYLQKVDFKN